MNGGGRTTLTGALERTVLAFLADAVAWLTIVPRVPDRAWAVMWNVRRAEIPNWAIVVQMELPERRNPGAEVTLTPGGGVSQTRTRRAAASPTLATRSV